MAITVNKLRAFNQQLTALYAGEQPVCRVYADGEIVWQDDKIEEAGYTPFSFDCAPLSFFLRSAPSVKGYGSGYIAAQGDSMRLDFSLFPRGVRLQSFTDIEAFCNLAEPPSGSEEPTGNIKPFGPDYIPRPNTAVDLRYKIPVVRDYSLQYHSEPYDKPPHNDINLTFRLFGEEIEQPFSVPPFDFNPISTFGKTLSFSDETYEPRTHNDIRSAFSIYNITANGTFSSDSYSPSAGNMLSLNFSKTRRA